MSRPGKSGPPCGSTIPTWPPISAATDSASRRGCSWFGKDDMRVRGLEFPGHVAERARERFALGMQHQNAHRGQVVAAAERREGGVKQRERNIVHVGQFLARPGIEGGQAVQSGGRARAVSGGVRADPPRRAARRPAEGTRARCRDRARDADRDRARVRQCASRGSARSPPPPPAPSGASSRRCPRRRRRRASAPCMRFTSLALGSKSCGLRPAGRSETTGMSSPVTSRTIAATGGILAAMTRWRGADVVQERSDIASRAARNGRKRAS